MKNYREVSILKEKKLIPKGKDPAPYGTIQIQVSKWQMKVTIIFHSNLEENKAY